MKKILFTLFITLIFSTGAFAQLVFQRIGGDTTYGSTGANYAYAYFRNSGSSSVDVRFKRILDNLPNASWSSSICVGVCYAPFVNVVPLEGDPAITLTPGVQDTMDITYDAPTLGVSDVIIRMYNENDTTQFVDRHFYLNVNSVGISNISSLAENFSLNQNYPNPFNPTTNIVFSIPTQENVSLKVYDILGNEVAVLLNNERLSAGKYKADFNGSNLSSGIYYYTIKANNFSDTKKMLLVK